MKVNFSRIIIPEHKEDFTNLITKLIQCKICLNILNDPCDCSCCNQTFCKNCINNYIQTNNKCPYSDFFQNSQNDQKPIIKSSSSNITNFIQSLKFRCQYCPKILSIEEITDHEKNCKFKNNTCSRNKLIVENNSPLKSLEKNNKHIKKSSSFSFKQFEEEKKNNYNNAIIENYFNEINNKLNILLQYQEKEKKTPVKLNNEKTLIALKSSNRFKNSITSDSSKNTNSNNFNSISTSAHVKNTIKPEIVKFRKFERKSFMKSSMYSLNRPKKNNTKKNLNCSVQIKNSENDVNSNLDINSNLTPKLGQKKSSQNNFEDFTISSSCDNNIKTLENIEKKVNNMEKMMETLNCFEKQNYTIDGINKEIYENLKSIHNEKVLNKNITNKAKFEGKKDIEKIMNDISKKMDEEFGIKLKEKFEEIKNYLGNDYLNDIKQVVLEINFDIMNLYNQKIEDIENKLNSFINLSTKEKDKDT